MYPLVPGRLEGTAVLVAGGSQLLHKDNRFEKALYIRDGLGAADKRKLLPPGATNTKSATRPMSRPLSIRAATSKEGETHCYSSFSPPSGRLWEAFEARRAD